MAAQELLKTVLFNNANLKAYYRFESGALTTDSSGQGKTLTNNNTVGEGTGVYGGSADFGTSNSNKYLSITSAIVSGATNWTISTWVKPQNINQMCMFFYCGVQPNNGWGLGLSNGTNGNAGDKLTLLLHGVAWVHTGIAFPDTNYHHLVLSRDASTFRIYLDGKFVYSTGTVPIAPGTAFTIGTGTYYYSGAVDDLAVFDTALSADQIKELYEGRIYGELRPNQFGTIQGLYHLSNTTDFSGNNNHLTNNGTTTFASGKFGNAADFGTSNSTKYLRVASAMSIDGGVITMGGWFKARAEIGSSSWIFCNQGNSNTKVTYRITYDYNSGTRRLQFSRVRQGVAADTANYTITLGTSDWYHLGLTYDGTTVKGYINGALVTSQASTGNGSGTTSSAFAIGSFEDGSGFASIYADEVFIASTALTANQIRQIYALGVGKYY